MIQREFRNILCILRSIDKHELVQEGVDIELWDRFKADPYMTFIQMSDQDALGIWRIVERRSVRVAA